MTKFTFITDPEGQLSQQLKLLQKNNPDISIFKSSANANANQMESHFDLTNNQNFEAEVRFSIQEGTRLILGGDALDVTCLSLGAPQKPKSGSYPQANGNQRDRQMAALVANTVKHYSQESQNKNNEPKFLLVADNRTTNKLRILNELNSDFFARLQNRIIEILETKKTSFPDDTTTENLKEFWKKNITPELKKPSGENNELFWTDGDNLDFVSELLFEQLTQAQDLSSDTTTTAALKGNIITQIRGLKYSEEADFKEKHLRHILGKTMGAGKALDCWLAEDGNVDSYIESIQNGHIRTIINNQKPIQLIAQGDKFLVYVHGAISPKTIELAQTLKLEFEQSHPSLNNFDVSDENITLQSLAEFFNEFYRLGIDQDNFNSKIYFRLQALALPTHADQNNLGSPFTTQYGNVEAQLADTNIPEEKKLAYYRVMKEAEMVFCGHNPLHTGGVQVISHPEDKDGYVHKTRVVLGDNSKAGLSCQTYEIDADGNGTLTVDTADKIDGAIEKRIYTKDSWNDEQLGREITLRANSKGRDADGTEISIPDGKKGRVVHKGEDSYTVAVTYSARNSEGKLIFFNLTSEVELKTPTQNNTAESNKNRSHVMPDREYHPHSSPSALGLFKKPACYAGMALGTSIMIGSLLIAAGLALTAASGGTLALPGLSLAIKGITICASAAGLSFALTSTAIIGGAFVAGGAITAASLHGLDKTTSCSSC